MFDISTSADFYEMLVEDFDELITKPDSARLALHCAISAYHLREWLWKDWLSSDTEAKEAIGVTSESSFNDWIYEHCVWFGSIRDLANGTKHFRQNPNMKTSLSGGYGKGPYGVGTYGRSYLLIDYGEEAGEHQQKAAISLIEVVVRFWRDFFRLYRPDVGVKHSQNHIRERLSP
jgi:hypothetical protein